MQLGIQEAFSSSTPRLPPDHQEAFQEPHDEAGGAASWPCLELPVLTQGGLGSCSSLSQPVISQLPANDIDSSIPASRDTEPTMTALYKPPADTKAWLNRVCEQKPAEETADRYLGLA